MAYPTDLDNLSADNPTLSDTLATANHHTLHEDERAAIESIETKIGVDSSAVTTSHDYKLSGVTGTDKAVSKTGAETLTDKTLTSPVLITPQSDTIAEKTADTGVTIDGLLIKDGQTRESFVGARAYLSVTLSPTVSTGFRKVLLNTESYDVGENFVKYVNNATTEGRFVVPVNGYYFISLGCGFTHGTVAKLFEAYAFKNDAAFLGITANSVIGSNLLISTSDIRLLTKDDWIELYYYQSDATTVDLLGGDISTYLTVHLIKEV